jgi:hypothetical protein
MITTHNLTGGPTYTADPVSENYRLLACAVLLRAWKDTRCGRKDERTLARLWLRSSVAVGLAESVGVRLPKVVRP